MFQMVWEDKAKTKVTANCLPVLAGLESISGALGLAESRPPPASPGVANLASIVDLGASIWLVFDMCKAQHGEWREELECDVNAVQYGFLKTCSAGLQPNMIPLSFPAA